MQYEYVDETPEIARCYTTDTTQDTQRHWNLSRNRSLSFVSTQPSVSGSYTADQETVSHSTDTDPYFPRTQRHLDNERENDLQTLEVSTRDGYFLTSSSSPYPDPHFRVPGWNNGTPAPRAHQYITPQEPLDLQEASLLRYFILELAPCVGITPMLFRHLMLNHFSVRSMR